jgi:predicted nucleic acid-binding protein
VNALVVAERRKKITPQKTARFLHDLKQFKIAVDLEGIDHAFGTVLDQARLHQRSSYDASYLELAMRRQLPFATKDEPLKKVVVEIGVPLFVP